MISAMVVSPFGLDVIKAYEGFFPRPYYCPAGILTQGYGHTAAAGGEPIGGVWGREKAESVLREDINKRYAPAVVRLLRRQPTQAQFDAMVSFVFNCGEANFKKSSILRHFNRGDNDQAAAAFHLWVKARNPRTGKMDTLPGLVRRRGTEALLFAGIKDINFDGKRGSGDSMFPEMPQKVDVAREKLGGSRIIKGAGATIVGGAALVSEQLVQVKQVMTDAGDHFSAGTWFGLAIGVVVLVGGAVALYGRWDDAGRPIPRWLRGEA